MSLEQDYTTVPGQLFACLSVVGPEAPQKNDNIWMIAIFVSLEQPFKDPNREKDSHTFFLNR